MLRRLSMVRPLLVVAALWVTQVPCWAQAAHDETVVMTRNLYFGADLIPVISAGTPAEFFAAVQQVLANMAATDFPQRADALAVEIAEKRPHLIGLQEAFRLTVNGNTGATPFRDFQQDLLDALAARGAEYYVVGQVNNLDVTIPVPGLGLVRGLDRDVVLARADVPATAVAVPGCRQSADGCNYQVFVPLPSLAGPINSERGFIVVDAAVGGHTLRFVNTHLEIPELPRVVQALQASELIAAPERDSATRPADRDRRRYQFGAHGRSCRHSWRRGRLAIPSVPGSRLSRYLDAQAGKFFRVHLLPVG